MNKPDLTKLAHLPPLRQARAEAFFRVVHRQRGVCLDMGMYEALPIQTGCTRQDTDLAINDLAEAGLINLSGKDTIVEIIDPTEKVDGDV